MNAYSFDKTAELMLVVERLATQDQRRIVKLIDLLAEAPDELRERTQSTIRALIAREPETHGECLAAIDAIIAAAERELDGRRAKAAGHGRHRVAATLP